MNRETITKNYERALVGTLAAYLMHGGKAKQVAAVLSWFKAEFIFDALLVAAWKVIVKLSEVQGPVTPDTLVGGLLKLKTTVEPTAVLEIGKILLEYDGLSVHLEFYAREVYESWRKREASEGAADASHELRSTIRDTDSILDDLSEYSSKYGPNPMDRIQDTNAIYAAMLDEIEHPDEQRDDKLPTGLMDLDVKLDGGLSGGSVTQVGARTSQGKTTFLGHVAANVGIEDRKPVVYFSLEMNKRELIERWCKWLCKKEVLEPSDRAAAIDKMKHQSRIEIYDDPSSIGQIESIVRSHVGHEHDTALVVVDYLQLVRSDSRKHGNREQEVADVSRRLKQLASETQLPILVACQLSRAAEQAPKPMLSHMRESGAIEQDANIVLLLDPFVRDEEGKYPAMTNPDKSSYARLDIAKNRNGRKGEVVTVWNKAWYRYELFSQYSEFDEWAP